ncbi:proline-specific peptidase [Zopfia rhizophila CBS 207.26]|uniref:Proline-specific peptidase n=1 Tax=Zopfia rhizophila CBS 207.26 TaxID=1314779 RepID=A0A6A6DFW2_9PEZI|nr:proline-specific peptidase [Zopfia rhizophila CBS 207.26]
MVMGPSSEGNIPFDVPDAGKPCSTWYRIVGDLDSSFTPLIVAHGGPGAAHEYLLPLTDLHEEYRIPIIFYDLIGCGRSTRLREKAGYQAFWTVELFIRELDNLIDYLDLGGMFGGVYAARHPVGLRKLILADAPSSIPLHLKGLDALVERLPEKIRNILRDCERRGDHESKEFQDACMEFYKRHLCRIVPFPAGVVAALEHLGEDPTVYTTMYGPSELTANGTLKHWEGWNEAHAIGVETLLISARYDEVQEITVLPWFRKIPKVKWIQLENSSHMCHFEERERYMKIVGPFLLE